MVVCVCAVFGQREKKKVMNYSHQVENCQKEIHFLNYKFYVEYLCVKPCNF